jgi:hypothetical protein
LNQLRDDKGEVEGLFLTIAELERLMSDYARVQYPLEELERIAQESGERTMAEVLSRLSDISPPAA